jgi:hypothetical protein
MPDHRSEKTRCSAVLFPQHEGSKDKADKSIARIKNGVAWCSMGNTAYLKKLSKK